MSILKRLRAGVVIAASAALIACGGGTPTIPTKTFNDKVAIAIQTVTVTREAATALLQAKKITLKQDQTVQADLDKVRLGIQSVQSLHTSNPTLADAQLVQLVDELDVVKAEVATGAVK